MRYIVGFLSETTQCGKYTRLTASKVLITTPEEERGLDWSEFANDSIITSGALVEDGGTRNKYVTLSTKSS